MADGSDREAGLWAYVKEAFKLKWNLLLLAGGVAAAFIAPSPDITLPLLGALEIAYLASMTANGRFRNAVDMKAQVEKRAAGKDAASARAQRSLDDMLHGLEKAALGRFTSLRKRCLEMRRIASGVRGSADDPGIDADLRAPALDELLWTFLRLLYTRQSLDRFLASTDADAIEDKLQSLRVKLSGAHQGDDARIIRSLEGNIENSEVRLTNYRKAAQNSEFVNLEIDRVEGQINALIEMSVSNQSPEAITAQVNSVVEEMGSMEETINELEQLTGLREELQKPPSIMRANLNKVAQG